MIKYAWCALMLSSSVASAQDATVEKLSVKWSRSGAFLILADESGNDWRYEPNTGLFDLATAKDLAGAKHLNPSRVAPDGKASAEIRLMPDPREGTWSKDGDFSVSGTGTYLVLINRDAQSWQARSLDTVISVEVFWSPDSRYALFAVESKYSDWPGQPTTYDFFIGASGDRVQILGPADLVKKAQQKVRAAAEGAKAVLIFTGRAKKSRAASVVYAAEGHQQQAQAIAAAIPGGATVEPLTWDAHAELVVALGKSVAGGKP